MYVFVSCLNRLGKYARSMTEVLDGEVVVNKHGMWRKTAGREVGGIGHVQTCGMVVISMYKQYKQ